MVFQGLKDNRSLQLWIHIGIWAGVLAIYLLFFGQFFSPGLSLVRGLSNLLPMMALFYFNLFLVNRFFEKGRYGLFVMAGLLLLALMVAFRVRTNLLFPDIDERVFLQDEQRSWFFGALATSVAVLVVSTFYQVLQNRYANEQRNLATIREQQEAQLQFLRAQINPHFLFNTLNNIYSLSVVKSDKTPDMVLRLSNLLRYVVYDGRSEQVELQREARQIRGYIELFQMRNEVPLDISFEERGQLDGIKVEPMILIPLVENCFKHCDFDTSEQAFARITLAVEQGRIAFETLNSRDENQQQKDRVGGVGLDNIRRRLQLKYENRFCLEIDKQAGRFGVRLELHLESRNSEPPTANGARPRASPARVDSAHGGG